MSDRVKLRAVDPEVADGTYDVTVTGGVASLTAATSGGGTGVVETIVPGTGIAVDSTDPANPVVSATGGGGSVAVEDEGAEVVAAASRLNFTGAGVTVTDAGSGDAQVYIPGGGGSGGNGWTQKIDDPLTSTANITPEGGTWAIGTSGYLEQDSTSAAVARARQTTQLPTDKAIEVEAKYLDGAGSIRRFGVLVGGPATGGMGSLVYLESNGSGTWTAKGEIDAYSLKGSAATSIPVDTTTWLTFRITQTGDAIVVRIGTTVVLSVSINSVGQYVGVYTYGAKAAFRNFAGWNRALPWD